MEIGRQSFRILFVGMIIVLLLPLPYSYLTMADSYAYDSRVGEQVAPERDATTVIVADSHGSGTIAAVAPDGTLQYYNTTYAAYHDVDQVAGQPSTVEYIAHDVIPGQRCAGGTAGNGDCYRTVIERLDVRTGEITQLYSRIRPERGSSAPHDFDRIDENRIVIAEIGEPDRVSIVNTETGIITWTWDPQSDYPVSSGGIYPDDWTHLNDVEVLDDGRITVSLRNQDQVVFINRTTGTVDSWTLGEDDAHDTLYEQHNPDYIDVSRGGPGVLVADSENSRVVEYQREGESWSRSWTWRDDRLQWPRDADRLPNGHTLITDTNGGRVLEIDRQGDIVWSIDYAGPYEAERLTTLPESKDGESAQSIGLVSQGGDGQTRDDGGTSITGTVVDLFPSLAINGALYLLPVWFTPTTVLSLFGAIVTAICWGGFELYHSPYRIEITTSS